MNKEVFESMSEQNNNPYIAGASIGGTETFVGRIDILKQVQYTLRHPQESAIVLHGQRRIGKTSILHELKKQLERTYHPVYFDLIGKARQSLEETLQDLANTISLDLDKGTVDLGHNPKTEFSQVWFPNLLNTLKKSLVLLFDEFDALDDPNLKETSDAFFHYVHGLLPINPERLSFVFVIGRNINDLHDVASALCKDVNDTIHVSLLEYEYIVKLVRFSVDNNTLHWADETIEKVWQLTQGHPYLTQSLCKTIWNRLYDENPQKPPLVTLNDIENAIPNALKSSHSALDWLWRGLPPAGRVVISALAEAGAKPITKKELKHLLRKSGVRTVIRELQNAPRLLQDWDLIEPVEKRGYRFRVELLRRWIEQYKPLSRVQEELDQIEPVANDIYKAALGLYNNSKLDEAVSSLQQAIEFNPNHGSANQLLAEILLAQNKTSKACEILEKLYRNQPNSTVRDRLIQALLTLAQSNNSENEQIKFYERILKLDAEHQEAGSKLQQILQQQQQKIEKKKSFLIAILKSHLIAIGKSLTWLTFTWFFGLLPLWLVLLGTLMSENQIFPLEQFITSGALLFFVTAIVTSVTVDCFLFSTKMQNSLGIFTFQLVSIASVLIASCAALFLVISVTTIENLNFENVFTTEISILLITFLYIIVIKFFTFKISPLQKISQKLEENSRWQQLFLETLRKSVIWTIMTYCFGLLPLWFVLIEKLVPNSNSSFHFEKFLIDGPLLFFATTIVSSITIDYLLSMKTSFYNERLLFNRLLFIVFPFIILYSSSVLFIVLHFNERLLNVDIGFVVEEVVEMEFLILITTFIYSIFIKYHAFK
jgi:hypothetical protein